MSAEHIVAGADVPTVFPTGPLEPERDPAQDWFVAEVDREIAHAARDAKLWDQVFSWLFDPHAEPLDPPERHREWQDVAADEAGVPRQGEI